MTGYYIILGIILLIIGVTSIPVNRQWEIDKKNELKEANK